MSKLVKLYALPDASIPGVPSEDIEVEPEEAEHLLEYQPPAFSKTKPKHPEAPDDAASESPEAP